MLNDLKVLIDTLSTLDDSEEIIDLTKIKWVTPLNILPVAYKASKKLDSSPNIKFKFSSEDIESYLNTILFPKGTSNLQIIKKGQTYLPIVKINLFQKQNLTNEILINSTISQYEKIMKENLIHDQTYKENISESVHYFLSEMIDNVEQHSRANEIWIMSQCWKNSDLLSFCILDDGFGMLNAYRNAGIDLNDDQEAIESALKGISIKKDKNRGFGIRTTINLMTHSELKGEFLILSGSAGYYLCYGKNPQRFALPGKAHWDGVLICANIYKPMKQINIYDFIDIK